MAIKGIVNTTRSGKPRYVLLPPEASTNWLFDENVLFHLLSESIVVFMDRSDYFRYKRLAALSDIDFLKYFLLTLLRRIGFLCLLDYKTICPPRVIEKSLDAIRDSRLLQDTERHQEVIRSGYLWYLDYISGKEKILHLIGSDSDRKAYEKEKAAAERDLSAMASSRFGKGDRHSYLRRLATKLLTAQTVCDRIGATIFDSREYQRGATLLKQQGLLPENARFENALFARSKAFDKLLSLCEKEGCLKTLPETAVSTSGVLRIWLPYAILERLSNIEQQLVSRLQCEILQKSKSEIEQEVEEWLQLNRKGLGGIEGHRHAKGALEAVVGIIPVVGQAYGIYSMLRSLFFIHTVSRIRVSSVAELIGIALATEVGVADIQLRYRLARVWIKWFYNIFIMRSSEEDRSWSISQREMGAWTDTDLYVPWYEYSKEKLQDLGLIMG